MTEYNLLLNDLNLCNCGNPEETIEWIHDGLSFFAERCPETYEQKWFEEQQARQLKHFGSDAGFQFFANWANTQGYADHGSNIIASWLTRDGEKVMERIEKVLKDLPEDV